jgi:hypothetical protein
VKGGERLNLKVILVAAQGGFGRSRCVCYCHEVRVSSVQQNASPFLMFSLLQSVKGFDAFCYLLLTVPFWRRWRLVFAYFR